MGTGREVDARECVVGYGKGNCTLEQMIGMADGIYQTDKTKWHKAKDLRWGGWLENRLGSRETDMRAQEPKENKRTGESEYFYQNVEAKKPKRAYIRSVEVINKRLDKGGWEEAVG